MLWAAIYFGLGLITTALTLWQYERDGGFIKAHHAVYLTLLGPIGLAAFIGQAVARAQKGRAKRRKVENICLHIKKYAGIYIPTAEEIDR